jgi:hypothetical protein
MGFRRGDGQVVTLPARFVAAWQRAGSGDVAGLLAKGKSWAQDCPVAAPEATPAPATPPRQQPPPECPLDAPETPAKRRPGRPPGSRNRAGRPGKPAILPHPTQPDVALDVQAGTSLVWSLHLPSGQCAAKGSKPSLIRNFARRKPTRPGNWTLKPYTL